jgi:hypothetical protein
LPGDPVELEGSSIRVPEAIACRLGIARTTQAQNSVRGTPPEKAFLLGHLTIALVHGRVELDEPSIQSTDLVETRRLVVGDSMWRLRLDDSRGEDGSSAGAGPVDP